MHTRDATYNDLPRVLDIERLSFAQPWSLNSFRRELSLSFSRLLVAVTDDADEGGGVIAGYLCRWLVAGESHILNVAVHPDFRRRGVGAALIGEAVAEARSRDAQLMLLEVRRSNLEARRLYRKFGFEERRLRRNYYGPGEDALVMELVPADSPFGKQRSF
ncbi:MAG TPA: ribosomal protein S18-alanine N-acetyltransferase [Candidatus Binataceae bacterium]|nr:ribosomal protein S18-alanine N-acetyltransferase [Candidatus Binataceae bacterium]